MDIRFTPEQEALRHAVRRWLEENLPPGWGKPEYRAPESGEAQIAFVKQWQRKLYDAGWAGLSWPVEYGGRGASVMEQLVFGEEYARALAPSMITLGVGLDLVGPTLIGHGQAWQRERFLHTVLTGEEIWCQGFSEPNAGSDLAAIRTRGEVRSDEIVVTGQKIWTSFASEADWCILIVRTDPDSERHKGLTFLLVDMQTPGITVRPLREITSEAWFNEVFFDQVRVPRKNVVGELDQGWNVIITTLMHERSATAGHVRMASQRDKIANLARNTLHNGRPASKDPLVRQQLARLAIDAAILRYTVYRNVTRVQRGGTPGPEGSITKLFGSTLEQRMATAASEILGPFGLLTEGDARAVEDGLWTYELLWSRAATIYAGTSEIQRNIISERVLGLPRA